MSPRRAKRSPCGGPSQRVEPHSSGWRANRPGSLDDGADPFGVREDIELFHRDANVCDARIGKANSADPFGETFAQINMPRVRDFADRCDNFFVIDNAPAILSGEGVRCRQVDRNANALLALTLA